MGKLESIWRSHSHTRDANEEWNEWMNAKLRTDYQFNCASMYMPEYFYVTDCHSCMMYAIVIFEKRWNSPSLVHKWRRCSLGRRYSRHLPKWRIKLLIQMIKRPNCVLILWYIYPFARRAKNNKTINPFLLIRPPNSFSIVWPVASSNSYHPLLDYATTPSFHAIQPNK